MANTNERIEDLQELQEVVRAADKKIAELKGRKKLLMEQLAKEYGCKTIEQAQKKLKKLREELTESELEFIAAMDEIDAKKENIDLTILEEGED